MASATASSSTMDPAKLEALKGYRAVSLQTRSKLIQQKVKEHSQISENLKKSAYDLVSSDSSAPEHSQPWNRL